VLSPYSPEKILCHHTTWLQVKDWYETSQKNQWIRFELPPPITVSVDLANKCNMRCIGCNADFLLKKERQCMLDKDFLDELADVLGSWNVKGVCLGGGGESTLNPNLSFFIDRLTQNHVGAGLISNGLLLHKHDLNKLKWLGVSMDAGTADVWGLVHGVKPELFDRVLDNIRNLTKNGLDITYKYLIRPENVNDVYEAVKKADELGCSAFHIRPMAIPWFEKKRAIFIEEDVKKVNEQLEKAKSDFKIKIIGVFNKVGQQWEIVHPFKKCWAIYITCVFMANKKVSFCCDRRGDKTVEIGPLEHPKEILNFWGSKKHFELQKKICLRQCSRCTFGYFNYAFENCVLEDNVFLDFI